MWLPQHVCVHACCGGFLYRLCISRYDIVMSGRTRSRVLSNLAGTVLQALVGDMLARGNVLWMTKHSWPNHLQYSA
jgi:hypothetical protein